MKKLFCIISSICIFGSVFAQGDYEAFRFSQTEYQGTARYMGAGGAFSATGGEFSALNSNPAAISLYKRNEVSFTPMTISFSKNSSNYFSTSTPSQSLKYTVPQIGIVCSQRIENSNWNFWHFGFGYNRIVDYNNTFRVNGNTTVSMMQPILNQANGTAYSFLTGDNLLAFNTWMIDTLPGMENQYYSNFDNARLKQDAAIKTSGAIDEMSFTFGGNFSDKLYIGGTLGIPILDYTEKITYSETATEEDVVAKGITSFTTVSKQKNSGGGVNLKLGIIYQPVNFVRIGAAFQSPTYFWRIKDSYHREMISYYTNGKNSGVFDYDNAFDFSLSTPLKCNISTAFLINKRAFVSAEYEFTDYSMANLYSDDYLFTGENEAISEKYGAVHTVKIGAEVNLSSKFAIRAGYNYKTSPYKLVDSRYNASAHYGSLGFGIHGKSFFFDLAYVLKYSNDSFWLYSTPACSSSENAVLTSNTTHRIVATVGCKF